MRLVFFIFSIPHLLLMGSCGFSAQPVSDNPFLIKGSEIPDGKLGAFKQNDTGDCFFLASLIAIAEDVDGRRLLESTVLKKSISTQWQVKFPNLKQHPVTVSQQDIKQYKLTHTNGESYSELVLGDPDIKILEIAADKIWKKHIKPKGLWDDVPMNALFMFSNARQLLILNRAKAERHAIQDIEQYLRLPEGVIKEIGFSTETELVESLKRIIQNDHDGISMVLIDYINYHAEAIVNIDFYKNSYNYIDTYSNKIYEKGLPDLIHGIAKGQYAINYVEINE